MCVKWWISICLSPLLNLKKNAAVSVCTIKWVDPLPEKEHRSKQWWCVLQCLGLLTCAIMLLCDDTQGLYVTGYPKQRWHQHGPVWKGGWDVSGDVFIRRGWLSWCVALCVYFVVVSVCVCVYRDQQHLAPQANSGCTQCWMVPDKTTDSLKTIVCYL